MSHLYGPYTVWYLEDDISQDELETEDGRQLDLTSMNPIILLKEETTGRDLVEGELRWKGRAQPGSLHETYGIDEDEARKYLETLEEEGLCSSKEWPGSFNSISGW